MEARDLKQALIGGAQFFCESISTSGQKAHSKKKIPDSEKQKVESLGNYDPTYKVSGYISPRYKMSAEGTLTQNVTYQEMKKALVAAFKTNELITFVNPFGENINKVVVIDWEFAETISSVGLAPVTFTMEISSVDSVIEEVGPSLDAVADASAIVDAAVHAELIESWLVTSGFSGNFQDALNKVDDVIDSVVDATEKVQIELEQLDTFYNSIAETAAKVTSLIQTPQDLADSVVNMVQSVGGLYTSAAGTVGAFRRLFYFGDADTETIETTVGLKERAKNRKTMNSAVKSLSLSGAYKSSAEIEYETVEEIDEMNELLENQFRSIKQLNQGMRAATIRETLHDTDTALEELRQRTQSFFDAERLSARRVIEVETNPTSTRLLAYSYYGSSALGIRIAKLNNLNESDNVSGTVKIFTE